MRFRRNSLANITDVTSPYLLGIVFHNLPISFILGTFLLREKTIFFLVYHYPLFALASPLGMVFGDYFNPNWQPYFLALVGGIFLHISSVIIFESNKITKWIVKTFFFFFSDCWSWTMLVNHLFHAHH